jgi:hypothetical protein
MLLERVLVALPANRSLGHRVRAHGIESLACGGVRLQLDVGMARGAAERRVHRALECRAIDSQRQRFPLAESLLQPFLSMAARRALSASPSAPFARGHTSPAASNAAAL